MERKVFFLWEFFGFCEWKCLEIDVSGIILYCKLFVLDKEEKNNRI